MVKDEAKKPGKVKSALKSVKLPKAKLGMKMPKKWLKAIGGYFSGAVVELKQVKWPNRKASISLTVAVILFTAVMSGFILALDYGFEQLFKQVIL
ncbi:MAG TPA: preprotein translocase subunit SecE [Candidatus Saccharimonadales bacterium]|nr:preprotein translocase subunit SecE [Candidatus Saccharimonadales bacterium]